jgi:hypothetical protein
VHDFGSNCKPSSPARCGFPAPGTPLSSHIFVLLMLTFSLGLQKMFSQN